MVVNENLANNVEDLQKKMHTSALDVVASALELLKLSLNNEVILRNPETGAEKKITAFKDIKDHE